MLNFPFWQTFYFTHKCNIAVQNIVKKAYGSYPLPWTPRVPIRSCSKPKARLILAQKIMGENCTFSINWREIKIFCEISAKSFAKFTFLYEIFPPI